MNLKGSSTHTYSQRPAKWGADRRQRCASPGLRPPGLAEKCTGLFPGCCGVCLEWRIVIYKAAAAWRLQFCCGQISAEPILFFFLSNTMPCPEEKSRAQKHLQASSVGLGVSETRVSLHQGATPDLSPYFELPYGLGHSLYLAETECRCWQRALRRETKTTDP